MKNIGRTVLLSAWISGIVLAFGCGGDTSPPLAPSPSAVADGSQRATGKPSPSAVADRGQRAAGNHGPAAAWNDGVDVPVSASSVDGDATGLKSTAPAPVSPTDGAEIDDQTPVLTASKATGVHAAADFEHEFTLFKITGGNRAEIERGRGTSQGASVTSYQVRKKLDLASSYSWRVRAVFDDEHGPWSADAGFRTTAVILGTPRPLSPGNGEAVGIRPVFRVRNGTVEGNAGTVSIYVQVATDGDFAGIVARAAARASSGENTEVRLDDDLMPAKTYFWRARAVSSAGRRPGSWSAVATFKTVAIRLGTPRPLSPIGGATTTTLRPVFKVRNGTVEGHTGVADIRLEVASDADFMKVVGRKTQTAARARGETDLRLSNELMRATRYYWRVRALLASPEVVSGWSAIQRFRTPDTAAFRPGGSPNRRSRRGAATRATCLAWCGTSRGAIPALFAIRVRIAGEAGSSWTGWWKSCGRLTGAGATTASGATATPFRTTWSTTTAVRGPAPPPRTTVPTCPSSTSSPATATPIPNRRGPI